MRWLVVAFGLATVTGCYATHVRGGVEARDTGVLPVDGSAVREDAARFGVDAPFVRPDAAFDPSCSARPIDVACTDTGTGFVPVGVPYELPVLFGDGRSCFCGEAIACSATVRGNEISLETRMCADLLCDGCFPYVEGTCALPPMNEGSYRVLVNGAPSLELFVSDATPAIGPVDACLTTPIDPFACGWDLDTAVAFEVDELCYPPVVRAGEPAPLEVHTFCLPCGSLWGPCRVERTATSVHVAPLLVTSRCDVDCEEECSDARTVCTIPPLEPGKYQLSVEGLDTISLFTVGDETSEARACVSTPED